MKKTAVLLLFVVTFFGLFFLKKNFNIKSKNKTATDIIMNWEHLPKKITVDIPVNFSFILKDLNGHPITNATLEIEANMNHSGMIPVFTHAKHEREGLYKTSVKLTMPGDWILFISISLQNGEVIKKEITFRTN